MSFSPMPALLNLLPLARSLKSILTSSSTSTSRERCSRCRRLLPLLNDGGSIIVNGSVASLKGTPAFGVYGATKAALRSFVRTWTSDLKDRHIRSNVVSPGPTDTPVIDGQPADAIARIMSTIPMRRMGEPDEIAKVVLFLASEDSSFVTGIELFVDGGRGQV
jgi:NAD(P)-dependent dehydrogenase (short-subunit alcohol dehydrogenase family)